MLENYRSGRGSGVSGGERRGRNARVPSDRRSMKLFSLRLRLRRLRAAGRQALRIIIPARARVRGVHSLRDWA